MSLPLLQADSVTLQELFGNARRYRVPPFQRNYAWREAQWEDLWDDLWRLWRGEEDYHYMGVMLFQKAEDGLVVVDGQQRLATFVLLALGVIDFLEHLEQKNVEAEKNRERREIFTRRFVGEKEPVRLMFQPRLRLNRVDHGFFNQYVLERKAPPRGSLSRHPSHGLLWKGFAYFQRRIREHFQNDTGGGAAAFLEKILDRTLFTQILTPDDLSAYVIFETLNARGIALTPTDLLKNYLFSLMQEADLEIVEEQWDRIVRVVGERDFPKYLRYFVNRAQKEPVRRERLYRVLRKSVTSSREALDLLERLEHLAGFYEALSAPDYEIWREFPDRAYPHVQDFNVFRAHQATPLLLALYEKWMEDPEAWRKVLVQALRLAVVVTVRYLTIGRRNPNRLERAFTRAAHAVHRGSASRVGDIFRILQEGQVYLDDETFQDAFAGAQNPDPRSLRVAKRLLLGLEAHLRGSPSTMVETLEDPRITVEHILPRHRQDVQWAERLGNLTLLEEHLNREARDRPFEEKREVYRRSRFAITRMLADYDRWDEDVMRDRQRKMAQWAVAVWRWDTL